MTKSKKRLARRLDPIVDDAPASESNIDSDDMENEDMESVNSSKSRRELDRRLTKLETDSEATHVAIEETRAAMSRVEKMLGAFMKENKNNRETASVMSTPVSSSSSDVPFVNPAVPSPVPPGSVRGKFSGGTEHEGSYVQRTVLATAPDFTHYLKERYGINDLIKINDQMKEYHREFGIQIPWNAVVPRKLRSEFELRANMQDDGVLGEQNFHQLNSNDVQKMLVEHIQPTDIESWVTMVRQSTKWRYGPWPREVTDEMFRKSLSLKIMQHVMEFTMVLRWLRGHFDPREKMDTEKPDYEPPFTRLKVGTERVGGSKDRCEDYVHASVLNIFLDSMDGEDILTLIHNQLPLADRHSTAKNRVLLHTLNWEQYAKLFNKQVLKISDSLRAAHAAISLVNHKKRQEDKVTSAALFSKTTRPRNTVAAVGRGGNGIEGQDTSDEGEDPCLAAVDYQQLPEHERPYCMSKLNGRQCPPGCRYGHSEESYQRFIILVRNHNPRAPIPSGKTPTKTRDMDKVRLHQRPKVVANIDEEDESGPSDSDEGLVAAVTQLMKQVGAKPTVVGRCGEAKGRALLDSGCLVGNIVDEQFLLSEVFGPNAQSRLNEVRPTDTCLSMADASPVTSVRGTITLTITLQGDAGKVDYTGDFIVMKSAYPFIVGFYALMDTLFPYYMGMLVHCKRLLTMGPTYRQLSRVPNPKDLYHAYRGQSVHQVNATWRQLGVPFCQHVEICEQHGEWGVRATRGIRRGEIVCRYSSERAVASVDQLSNMRYALILDDNRVYDAPAEGDLQYGPLINDGLDTKADNVQPVVSHSNGLCSLRATRHIKPGELLSLPYGADSWHNLLLDREQELGVFEMHMLRDQVEHRYKVLVAALDFSPMIGDIVEPFTTSLEAAEEDDMVGTPANSIPAEVLAVSGYENTYTQRRHEYMQEIEGRCAKQLIHHCPAILDFLRGEMCIDVFVPKDWTGVKHPDLGEVWTNVLEWTCVPKSSKTRMVRVRPQQYGAAQKEVQHLVNIEFWVETFSQVTSPMLVAPKATDPFIRIVSDYAWLTPYLVVPRWPLPHVKDSLDFIKRGYGAAGVPFKVFFDLDMLSSFHQIRIDEASSRYLSVMTPWGQYRPQFLPEGIAPATAVLQRVVDTVFATCKSFMLVIYDNFLVCGTDYEDAFVNFQKVIRQCAKTNIKLKLRKCHFGVTSVDFFGYRCTGDGYGLTEERVLRAQAIPFPGDTGGTPKQKTSKMLSYVEGV